MVSPGECRCTGSPAVSLAPVGRRPRHRGADPWRWLDDARRGGFAYVGGRHLHGHRSAPLVGLGHAHAGRETATRIDHKVGGLGLGPGCCRRLDVARAHHYRDRHHHRTACHGHVVPCGANAAQRRGCESPRGGNEARRQRVAPDAGGPTPEIDNTSEDGNSSAEKTACAGFALGLRDDQRQPESGVRSRADETICAIAASRAHPYRHASRRDGMRWRF